MQSKTQVKIHVLLPEPILKLLRQAGRTAEQSGSSLFLVGGAVRDLLLGRNSRDIDLMTTGNAIMLAEKLAAVSGARPTFHKKFGTATFSFDDYRIDLSTCRSEIYSRPGALPQVRPGNIDDDLFRRDFTINAMAVNIGPSHFGEMIDPYGGQADLKSGLIRILHDKSFQDDATRIMRAIRYEQRLNFRLETNTAALLRKNLDMLDTISGVRLRNELFLWFGEQNPEKILKRADRLGVLQKIHPHLHWDHNLHTAFKRAELIHNTDKTALYFCLLVYHLDKDSLSELLQRLSLTGTRYGLFARHAIDIRENRQILMQDDLKNSAIFLMLKSCPTTAIQASLVYPGPRRVRSRLLLYLKRLSKVRLLVNGTGLSALGIRQGPAMGKILSALFTAKLDGLVKSRLDEEKLALSLLTNEIKQR